MIVSFDVTLLFTKTPTEIALKEIRYMIENDASFLERMMMVGLCSENYLQFDGKKHKQVRGTPMESPFSRLPAAAAMKQIEIKAFGTPRARLWVRYVDGTFVVLEKHKLDEFHNSLKTLVPEIEFTRECKTILSFLDVLIMRQADVSMETTIY